jgi:hypothetical protein
MQAQAHFTPELARGNARTDTAPLPAAQSVGFVRNTGGTARIFPSCFISRTVLFLKKF